MDKLDKQILEYLEREAANLKGEARISEAPSTEEYCQFLHEELEGEALKKILQYLRNNPAAQKMIAQARRLVSQEKEANMPWPPADWVKKAKDLMPKNMDISCPHCGKGITPFKKPAKKQNLFNWLWLALCVTAFSISFIYRHYFFQCLAAAVLFGIKAIIDLKSTKTQILIYKALKEEEGHTRSKDLQNLSSHL